jgi:hypothetical protein
VSAARARRRLMAHERYRRRYWLLGVGIPGFVGPAHHRAWCHVDHLQQTRRGWPWVLHEPSRRSLR